MAATPYRCIPSQRTFLVPAPPSARHRSGDANALDRHDPNYDSEEDDKDVVLLRNAQSAMRQEVALYKEEVGACVLAVAGAGTWRCTRWRWARVY